MKQLTGQRLMEVRAGLSALKERRLELGVDLRVAQWWAALTPSFEAYINVLKKIEVREVEAQVVVDHAERMVLLLSCARERETLQTSLFDAPAPKRPLVPADMPKEHKGTGGVENVVGVAGLMILLAPEYLTLPDESE